MKDTLQSSSLLRTLLYLTLCTAIVFLSACGKSRLSSFHEHNVTGSAIAASAKSQIGKPYRKGGISPQRGFDCSGLVYWAYRKNGVAVPRVSEDQADAGRKVRKRELRLGDIVVFKTSWFSYHTGIYIGQGRFVHSPKPRTRVRIDSLEHEYWKDHFICGRRVTSP